MCGIAGYVDLEGGAPDIASVQRMCEAIAHRGPDGEAITVVASGGQGPTAVLGHRRLRIIDLTDRADQPLPNEDGSIVVTFNGEIYGFDALRTDLKGRGHAFRSAGDTEVIVHGYEEFGDDVVDRLDGMFAFALWDGPRRRLLLARDRVGKKPLFTSWDGRRLTFASEIGALRRCPWVGAEPDLTRIPEMLVLGYVPTPATIHADIGQVPPASVLSLDAEGVHGPSEYWRPVYEDGHRSAPPRAEVEMRTHELLRAAVERRLVADVPLGVLLSGGLDSSVIVALMAELGVPISTFAVGVGDDASYDERRFARTVAQRFGTKHLELEVRADAATLAEDLVSRAGQPFADSSMIPTYLIARAAREHVTVVLTGDGGDETFGGYERFAAAIAAARVPAFVHRAMGTAAGLLPGTGSYFEMRSRIRRFTADPGGTPEQRYRGWVSVFDPATARSVLSSELHSELDSVYDSFDLAVARAGDVPLLHRLMAANLRTYLLDDLLVKTDRMTMASSLEARSPLLDTELISYVASLPPATKVGPAAPKRLLRRVAAKMLPREIVSRRKHGFGVPVGRWFRLDLREMFQDLVLAPDARANAALDPSGVHALYRDHQEGGADHGPKLWALLSLELWLRALEASGD